MGGNILPHMATIEPERIEAMVVVSATVYFPEQARAIMRQVPVETNLRSNGKQYGSAISLATSRSSLYGNGSAG
jgi:hypothetical protein